MILPPNHIVRSLESANTPLRGTSTNTQSDLAHNFCHNASDDWYTENEGPLFPNSSTVKDTRSPPIENGNFVAPHTSISMPTSSTAGFNEDTGAESPLQRPETRQVTPPLKKPRNRSRRSTTQSTSDQRSFRTRSEIARRTRSSDTIYVAVPVEALKQKSSLNKRSKSALAKTRQRLKAYLQFYTSMQ